MRKAEDAYKLQQELRQKNELTAYIIMGQHIDEVIMDACDRGRDHVVARWEFFKLDPIKDIDAIVAAATNYFIPELQTAGYEANMSLSHHGHRPVGINIAWGPSRVKRVSDIVDEQLE